MTDGVAPSWARLFLALVPPRAVRERLAAAARSLGHAGRPVPTDNIHLTLAFLGPVPAAREAQAVAAAESCAGNAAFELCLERVGHWRRPRVLWCAPLDCPPALVALAASLARALGERGFRLEARPFAAHLTLARKVSHYRGQNHLPEPVGWPVDTVQLMASETRPQGARYRCIQAVGLQHEQPPV